MKGRPNWRATLLERTAQAELCPRCRRSVMVGLNGEVGGWEVSADPQPLSPLGEAVALMTGRGTVTLRWRYDHYEITSRDYFQIRGSPAGTNGMDVLVIHDCDRDYGGLIPNCVATARTLWTSPPLPDMPPF